MKDRVIYMDPVDWDVSTCPNGYFNNWTDGRGTCVRCPAQTGVGANSRVNNNPYEYSDATDCYMVANTDHSDTTGIYQYTTACYYTE